MRVQIDSEVSQYMLNSYLAYYGCISHAMPLNSLTISLKDFRRICYRTQMDIDILLGLGFVNCHS